MSANPFAPATKKKSFLRLALSGISGSGKTYSALNIARYLVPGGKIAVIDTEHGSASKYADVFGFDVVELNDYSPRGYIAMIQAAAANGYDVLIIDSLSHAWVGEGGVLDLVNKATLASKSKNAYTEGWSKGTPAQNALVEAILSAPCHVIATMRAKSDYIMEEDRNGRSAPKKIGLAPVQREGMEYEFDVVAEMNLDHMMIVEKTRCSALDKGVFTKPGQDVADKLRAWLSDGAEPAPVVAASVPVPTPEPPAYVVPADPQTPRHFETGTNGKREPTLAEEASEMILENERSRDWGDDGPPPDFGSRESGVDTGVDLSFWNDKGNREKFYVGIKSSMKAWGVTPGHVAALIFLDKWDDHAVVDVVKAAECQNAGEAIQYLKDKVWAAKAEAQTAPTA